MQSRFPIVAEPEEGILLVPSLHDARMISLQHQDAETVIHFSCKTGYLLTEMSLISDRNTGVLISGALWPNVIDQAYVINGDVWERVAFLAGEGSLLRETSPVNIVCNSMLLLTNFHGGLLALTSRDANISLKWSSVVVESKSQFPSEFIKLYEEFKIDP